MNKQLTYPELWHMLRPLYGEAEAKAVARWLLEVCFGLSLTDIAGGAVERWVCHWNG